MSVSVHTIMASVWPAERDLNTESDLNKTIINWQYRINVVRARKCNALFE